jgi:hypothetical protein
MAIKRLLAVTGDAMTDGIRGTFPRAAAPIRLNTAGTTYQCFSGWQDLHTREATEAEANRLARWQLHGAK